MKEVHSLYQAEDWFRCHPNEAVSCIYGTETWTCLTREEVINFYERKDERLCHCCGQPRPYPTEPGIWEFSLDPTFHSRWLRVVVASHIEGLSITPVGETESIWWPNNAIWRKII